MRHASLLCLFIYTTDTSNLVTNNERGTSITPTLQLNHDHKFHITMFNDLHLGDGARPGTDAQTISVMTSVLSSEPKTDLVVLNGDLTSCEWLGPEAVNGVLDEFIDPLLGWNIPFATTFGNHDMS